MRINACLLVGWIFSSFACSHAFAVDAVRWQPSLEAAQRVAVQTNRPVLVHFYTDSCGPCKQLDRTVFSQGNVAQFVEQRFVPVKMNAEHFPARATQWGVTTVPSDVILSPSGQLITMMKVNGNSSPEQYLTQVSRVPQMQSATSSMVAQGPSSPAPYGASPSGPMNAAAPSGAPAPTEVASQVPSANQPAWAQGFTPAVSGNNGPFNTSGNANRTSPMVNHRAAIAPSNSNIAQTAGVSGLEQTALANNYQPPVWATSATHQAPQPSPVGGQLNNEAPQWSRNVRQERQSSVAIDIAQRPSAPAPETAPPGLPTQAQPVRESQPPLALDGFCPVSLVQQFHLPVEQQKWMKGDVRWGAVHRGRTYLFAGPQQQQEFLANPDHFSPALSGNDPILSFERGVPIPGTRAFGLTYNSRIYLFANEASLNQFWTNPEQYATSVLQAERPQQTRLR